MWVAKDKASARFYARCHYAGIIEIQDTQDEAIAFERFNHKGLFRESGLWIDLNQNKELDEENEHFQDGDLLHIEDEQYQLELRYP
ncbi:MAG: hypothetical protein GY801_11310 [bacterium]|nr:hypothetical protein [bacterium]